jgi:hypothetical protein
LASKCQHRGSGREALKEVKTAWSSSRVNLAGVDNDKFVPIIVASNEHREEVDILYFSATQPTISFKLHPNWQGKIRCMWLVLAIRDVGAISVFGCTGYGPGGNPSKKSTSLLSRLLLQQRML